MSERIIADPPVLMIAERVDHLASEVMNLTGRHGVTRISLTPDVGLSLGIAPGTSVEVATSAGPVAVSAGSIPRRRVDTPVSDAAVLRGLEKLRNESRSVGRTERIDDAIARIEADARELAKADRRTAEQERVITAQRAEIDSLRARIETQATWIRSRNPLENGKTLFAENERLTNEVKVLRAALEEATSIAKRAVRRAVLSEDGVCTDEHPLLVRIAELRKLTEAP